MPHSPTKRQRRPLRPAPRPAIIHRDNPVIRIREQLHIRLRIRIDRHQIYEHSIPSEDARRPIPAHKMILHALKTV